MKNSKQVEENQVQEPYNHEAPETMVACGLSDVDPNNMLNEWRKKMREDKSINSMSRAVESFETTFTPREMAVLATLLTLSSEIDKKTDPRLDALLEALGKK